MSHPAELGTRPAAEAESFVAGMERFVREQRTEPAPDASGEAPDASPGGWSRSAPTGFMSLD